jgi:hypothetical protein
VLLKKTQACYCFKTDGDILEMLQAMTAERNVKSDYIHRRNPEAWKPEKTAPAVAGKLRDGEDPVP